MFTIRIADLNVQVNNKYPLLREKCADYIIDDVAEPDLIMSPTDEEIRVAQNWYVEYENMEVTPGEAEFSCAPFPLYPRLPQFDAVWLHAAVLEREGGAYAFTAPSGYGKSTHAKLWLKVFGDQTRIINGDNPILRMKDGVFHAYGTPFCGKEGYQVNTGAPLRGICILHHAETNSIRRIDPSIACSILFRSNTRIPPDTVDAHLALYDQLVSKVPVYVLSCNMEDEAALVSWEGMRPGAEV